MAASGWSQRKVDILDAFILSNYAFLILDVYLAHSVNRFRHGAEWIPVGLSVVAVLVLAPALVLRLRGRGTSSGTYGGFAIGYSSIAVGVAGVAYHLDSQFFSQWTVQSLVYTAPFVAPAAYAGLGFLLLLNRMVPSRDAEWSQWVVLLALGGFVGNFVLSLADHAINGFFYAAEWVPVFASGMAVGFLGVALVERHSGFLWIVAAVLILQVGVGIAGFYFHLVADINGLSSSLFDNFIHGAPVFAPLLFVDLALLAMIGLWERHALGDAPSKIATAPNPALR